MISADPNRQSRLYALLYFLFGALAVAAFAVIVPPYQVPDEPAQFKRADQVSRGVMVSPMIGVNSGGFVGAGIETTYRMFSDIDFTTTSRRHPTGSPGRDR